MQKALIAVLALAGALFIGAGSGQTASDFSCNGASTGGTFNNVTVPDNASCTLDHTKVLGNITVKTNARLLLEQLSGDSTVRGKINANNCAEVNLETPGGISNRIVVGGDLVITNCTSGFDGARGTQGASPPNVVNGGNVKCANNADDCAFDYDAVGRNLDCSGNFGCTLQSDAVGGDVTVKNNNGAGGSIFNGAFAGNLTCSGNTPPAFATTTTVAGTQTGEGCV
jgi:hypothetical protein